MLTIRREQMDTLGQDMQSRFEDFMVEHLRHYFPERSRELGEEAAGEAALRAEIRIGIERAEEHGFTAERDVCKYLDLMFELGRDFDSDPALPWVRPILDDKSLPHPEDRINRLVAEALGRG